MLRSRNWSPVVETQRLLRLIEEISEVEATIRWASNKKLHLEIALIRAIHTLSEVSLENVVDALKICWSSALTRGRRDKDSYSPRGNHHKGIDWKSGVTPKRIAEASPSTEIRLRVRFFGEERSVQNRDEIL